MTSEEIFFLIGQIIGFVAVAVAAFSFQAKKRATLLVVQTVSSLLWAAHFIMIGAPTGSVLNLLSAVRNLIYAKKKDWRWVRSPATPSLIALVAVGLSMLTYNDLFSLLPMAATILSSIAFFLDKERTIRIISLFVSTLWIIYNVYIISVSGICTEILNIASIIIALIRFRSVTSVSKNEQLSSDTDKGESADEGANLSE